MPGRDGTGPVGMGPMTGRAAGFCARVGVPGNMNGAAMSGLGRGAGMGGGRGRRGWRHQFFATGLTGRQRAAMGYGAFGSTAPYVPADSVEQQQIETLETQAQYFQDGLENIRKRIEELQAGIGKGKGESNG